MCLRRLTLLALIFGGTYSCSFADESSGKYALLIGVTKYDHAAMSPLEFPEADAEAIGKLLQQAGYEIDMLLGKKATQQAIREKLDGLNEKGTADGIVVIGLFGHGVEIEIRNSISGEQGVVVTEGCFCPYDTKVRLVKDAKGNQIFSRAQEPLTEPDPASLIKLADVMASLRIAKAGSRVVFADCCREVPNAARGRSFGASFQAKDLPGNTSVLFGCSPREKAFEHKDWGHGAFTKCLLEEIPRLMAEGEAETGTLATRLKKKVPQLVASVSPRDTQTPVPFFTNTVDLRLTQHRLTAGNNAGELLDFNGIRFRWCPAGTFTMGKIGENDVKTEISRGFWLSETEITQKTFFQITGRKPWLLNGVLQKNVRSGDNLPASYVNYLDAIEFCEKLTDRLHRQNSLPLDWRLRLPTEAQWEYANRAGSQSAYCFGDNANKLADFAWFDENTAANGIEHAQGVGKKKANSWNFYDMHGNVWEWCADWYGKDLVGGKDPLGPRIGDARVQRGGSWRSTTDGCQSHTRYPEIPTHRGYNVGFRVALVLEAKQ